MGFALPLQPRHHQLGCKGGLRKATQGGEHLARLIGVIVNGLLAHHHKVGSLASHHGRQQFGNCQWLQTRRLGIIKHHQHRTVSPHGHGRSQHILAHRGAATHGHHLGGHARFLKPNRLLHRNFIKGVHAHFHVGDVHIRAVGLDPNLHVVVHHALYSDQNFHVLDKPQYNQHASVHLSQPTIINFSKWLGDFGPRHRR